MMVENSMADWFTTLTSDLNWFEANLFMTNDITDIHHDVDLHNAMEHFGVESENTLSFAISFGNWHWFTLKERVEAIEAKVEGLGETAIHWLDRHIAPLCTAVYPNFTLYAAQYAYWYGEDDESVMLEEYGMDADDADVYRRADFDACFPKISYEASEKLDKDALQGLLSHPDSDVAALAAMLLEPEVAEGVGGACVHHFTEDHTAVLEPAICLAWCECDDSVRIADDFFNMEGECGGTDVHAMWTVENSAEGLMKARTTLEKYITELKKIENVLSIVAQRNTEI